MHALLEGFHIEDESFMPVDPLGFWFNMYYEVVARKM